MSHVFHDSTQACFTRHGDAKDRGVSNLWSLRRATNANNTFVDNNAMSGSEDWISLVSQHCYGFLTPGLQITITTCCLSIELTDLGV